MTLNISIPGYVTLKTVPHFGDQLQIYMKQYISANKK